MKTPVFAAIALCAIVSLATLVPGSAASRSKSSSSAAPKAKAAEMAAPKPKTSSPAKEEKAAAGATKTGRIPAKQVRAKQLVDNLTDAQRTRMLALLNEGTARDLAGIKGIAKTRGAAIEGARPFLSIDQVILVEGIGETTFGRIVEHARALTTSSSRKAS
ncbi:MAG: hypothetical protein KDM91_21295 [Verrucomicrobiae bacterium]|nr:hypothetical protein [Verrucomicrobiae bacterium]MCP5541135.1 hypothetical protein [Akkermansiaceae bacterium]MCP5551256.1 hypothetical protein [Akkermansiaceae bacterium]